MKQRKHIYFYGRVQGVGFRWKARHAADLLNLTGWVRNLYNGNVEMEVQGEEESIDRLIQILETDRFIRIDKMDVLKLPLEEERNFKVRG